jgi:hypothetical protein
LILELFEKLYRLDKYIKTCEHFDRKNNNDKIIALFKTSIRIIGEEIDKLSSDIDTDLDDTDKLGYIIGISQNSKAIIKIHEELRNLHSSWILPEIKTFANEIILNNSSLNEEINIILSDNYSFLESNLGKKFEKSLQNVYLKSDEATAINDNHSFILPKIEFSNPLNWTIIVHEAGHLNSDVTNAIRNNPDIMPDDIASINEELIKNWAEEIYCDIYATSILGPAYLISFITFALLSPLDYGISSHSDNHPSVIIRVAIILNYLRENSMLFNSEGVIEDYCKIFEDCLMEQHSIFKDEPTKKIKGLTKFNRNLRKILKELKLNSFSITEEDSKRINTLVSKLEDGIPIGSICDQNKAAFLDDLKNPNLTKEELKKLKNSVSERSCKIWEILNAGWLFKLEIIFKKGESIFFTNTNTKSLAEKIGDYGNLVDVLDERLLSSINTSQIMKIIENK